MYYLLRVKFWHLREDGHFYLIFISRHKLEKEILISCKEEVFTRENSLSQGNWMMEQGWTEDLWNSCSATRVCDLLGIRSTYPVWSWCCSEITANGSSNCEAYPGNSVPLRLDMEVEGLKAGMMRVINRQCNYFSWCSGGFTPQEWFSLPPSCQTLFTTSLCFISCFFFGFESICCALWYPNVIPLTEIDLWPQK